MIISPTNYEFAKLETFSFTCVKRNVEHVVSILLNEFTELDKHSYTRAKVKTRAKLDDYLLRRVRLETKRSTRLKREISNDEIVYVERGSKLISFERTEYSEEKPNY